MTLTHLPTCAGIYSLWNSDGTCVYVGQALNILARAKQHLRGLSAGRYPEKFQEYYDTHPNIRVEVLERDCREDELDKLEARYIAELRPMFNIQISRGLAFKARQPKRRKFTGPARALGRRMVPQIRRGRTVWITRKIKPRKAA